MAVARTTWMRGVSMPFLKVPLPRTWVEWAGTPEDVLESVHLRQKIIPHMVADFSIVSPRFWKLRGKNIGISLVEDIVVNSFGFTRPSTACLNCNVFVGRDLCYVKKDT